MKVFHFKTEQRLQKICLVSGIIFVNSLCASVKSGKLIHSRHMFIHMTVTADMSIMEVWYLLHQLAQRNQSYQVSAMLLLLVLVFFFVCCCCFHRLSKKAVTCSRCRTRNANGTRARTVKFTFPVSLLTPRVFTFLFEC